MQFLPRSFLSFGIPGFWKSAISITPSLWRGVERAARSTGLWKKFGRERARQSFPHFNVDEYRLIGFPRRPFSRPATRMEVNIPCDDLYSFALWWTKFICVEKIQPKNSYGSFKENCSRPLQLQKQLTHRTKSAHFWMTNNHAWPWLRNASSLSVYSTDIEVP